MESQKEQNTFEGWAVVELFGHQREAGYVTTEAFGQAVLFRVDVPEVPEDGEHETTSPQYIDGKLVPAGSKVRRLGVNGRTRYLGPGAIYAINPCSEESARVAVMGNTQRPIEVIRVAHRAEIEAAEREWADPLF